jgi:prepilin-type N-terminal cleavage/methylation domain-containing protein
MNQNKGFSLFELIVVLMIAGILATFVVVLTLPASDTKLRAEANKLISIIRYTQQLSISNSLPTATTPTAGRYRLYFNSNYYGIFDSSGNNLNDTLAVCLNFGQIGNAKYYCNLANKHSLLWPGKPAAYYLVFDRTGIPYSSSFASEQNPTDDAKLLDVNGNPTRNTIQITNGHSTITITIDPYTGYVSSN